MQALRTHGREIHHSKLMSAPLVEYAENRRMSHMRQSEGAPDLAACRVARAISNLGKSGRDSGWGVGVGVSSLILHTLPDEPEDCHVVVDGDTL